MSAHPHAELLRALADGSLSAAKEFECFFANWSEQPWVPAPWCLSAILLEPQMWQVRRKLKTVKIGGVEVQAGITEAPKHGTEIWVADATENEYAWKDAWLGTAYDKLRLQRGLLHLTKEPAVEMGRALAALTEHKE